MFIQIVNIRNQHFAAFTDHISTDQAHLGNVSHFYKTKDIKLIEEVQRQATKLVHGVGHLHYDIDILTDFNNSFTGTLCGQFAIKVPTTP